MTRCEVKELAGEAIEKCCEHDHNYGIGSTPALSQEKIMSPGISTHSKQPIIEPGLPACSQKNRISFQKY